MVEFRKKIAKKWNISENTASELCKLFDSGDTIYYSCDYHPLISSELDISVVFDIFNYLQDIKNLSPKKKRVTNALIKAEALTPALKNRIKVSTDSNELDDILLPFRPNSRSRSQQAINKGLTPLADIINDQEIEDGTIEELAAKYIGTHPSLKKYEDVIRGAKDILAERYAYDETVRSMVREVGFEDGFFEVVPRNKNDKKFLAYRGKMIPINEITSETFLNLTKAEESKHIRFKHGIQLFHINELLRHHFIENPDSISFDILCEVIDDCWSRLLQPVVERDAKAAILKIAEDWAIKKMDEELRKRINEPTSIGTILAISKFDKKNLIIVAITEDGHLLGATKDTVTDQPQENFSNRLKQFFSRYKPQKCIINESEYTEEIESIITKTLKINSPDFEIRKFKCDSNKDLLNSPWMKERCSLLEDSMKETYSMGIKFLQPLSVIPQIGLKYFSIHPLQEYLPIELLESLVNLRITEKELQKGIICHSAPESVLQNFDCLSKEVLQNIRTQVLKGEVLTKNDLLSIKGVTEQIFKNIAGYLIFPNSKDILDRTLVHPVFFEMVNVLSQELNISIESLVHNPGSIRTVECSDFTEKQYIDSVLTKQLAIGQNFPLHVQGNKPRRKQRLSELKEGSIITGTVTNITKFGVFVDINAVCDGLIHISQLTDGYIETADQVVQQNDKVDVRILSIDKKKRRVSLSMKKMGSKAPKIRPSQGQLTNLADFFKNR